MAPERQYLLPLRLRLGGHDRGRLPGLRCGLEPEPALLREGLLLEPQGLLGPSELELLLLHGFVRSGLGRILRVPEPLRLQQQSLRTGPPVRRLLLEGLALALRVLQHRKALGTALPLELLLPLHEGGTVRRELGLEARREARALRPELLRELCA